MWRVTVAQDKVMIEIKREGLVKRLLNEKAPSSPREKQHPSIVIEVSVRFQRRGVEAKLIVLDQKQLASAPDRNLVKALARAHEWFGRIRRGEASGVGDIARAERLDRTFVTRVICLAFLTPETTRAIVQGRQPTDLTVKRLVSSALKIPVSWPEQIAFISSAKTRSNSQSESHGSNPIGVTSFQRVPGGE